MSEPLLMRKRTMLAKIEAVYGADPTPTGAADAILIKSLDITPIEASLLPRDLIRPFMGNSENLVNAAYTKLDFECELAGSGTLGKAPAFGKLLRACGMAETIAVGVSVAYTPVSGAFESATFYVNVDGVLHKMLGARGTFSLAMSAGTIPTIKFSFSGLYGAVTDTIAPAVVLTDWQQPLPINNRNTSAPELHGFAGLVMSDLSVDIANAVTFRSLVGGSESVLITDRKTAGSITFEATKIADKNWFAAALTAALGLFSVTHGTVAGNKVTVAAPKTQITAPKYSDKDGVAMLQCGLVIVPGTGNDELTLTFK
ncbi:hypothetical protein BA896_012720 [Janthinobacterium lividum]|uniref:Phage tail protein n=1 Tax=Janthinobacterium lividum TaxID=29581 RepID=A0A1E8PTW2_9BURK|nr:hypothetical protein BA896_012720 [Janthinobacterium lividum]